MHYLRTLLMLSLAYVASGFVNIIGGIQLRSGNTNRFQVVPALKMCNFNATDLFERLKGDRRSLVKAAILTGLSTSVITVEPYTSSAESDHSWTQHSGPFTEDYIKDFQKTSSGLLYKDVQTGRGLQTSKDGDTVTLDMVGYIFESGEKWCNTYKGIPTYKSVIRAGPRENQKFMKGLNEGVLNLKKGAKRILVIPAYLAYNYVAIYSQNDPSQIIIPGGAALVCYVEVLDVKPYNA